MGYGQAVNKYDTFIKTFSNVRVQCHSIPDLIHSTFIECLLCGVAEIHKTCLCLQGVHSLVEEIPKSKELQYNMVYVV